jgi:uncharacterized membrane protein
MARKPVRRTRRPKSPLLQRLRNDFLTGLVVVLPIFLTVYIVVWFVGFVDDKVAPLVPRAYDPENIFGRNVFGFGLALFVAFTTLVGALAKNLIGRQVLAFGETILGRTPIVRPIYNGLKQIAETLFASTGNNFQQTCLVEFPRRGIWRIGFVSNDALGEIPGRAGETDMLSVFLPHTPNPTTGFLIFLPRSDVTLLDMTVEEAVKVVISGGLVSPPTAQPAGSRPVANPPEPASAARLAPARPGG